MADAFYGFGSNGAYSLNAQQATASSMSNMWSSAGTATTGLSGLTYGNVGASLSQLIQYFPPPQGLSEIAEKVKSTKKKVKGVLANLRSEIDGWHGDVLDRCAA